MADLYRDGRGVRGDRNRALALYNQACDAKLASACIQAALIYRHAGRDTEAQAHYQKACSLGDRSGCEHLW
jgi:TPR repeat protein